MNTTYQLTGLVFVLGTIVSMGLSLTIKQITGPLRNARFVIVGLTGKLYRSPPIAAYIPIQVFSLDEALATGLLLVSWLAAGAPGLPKMAEFAKQDTAAATSLMVLLVWVTIIALPIALPLPLSGGLGHVLGYRLRVGLSDPYLPGREPVGVPSLSGSCCCGAALFYAGLQYQPVVPDGSDGGVEFQ